jgi:hypothetical protein
MVSLLVVWVIKMVLETLYRGIHIHKMLPRVYHRNLQTTYIDANLLINLFSLQ